MLWASLSQHCQKSNGEALTLHKGGVQRFSRYPVALDGGIFAQKRCWSSSLTRASVKKIWIYHS